MASFWTTARKKTWTKGTHRTLILSVPFGVFLSELVVSVPIVHAFCRAVVQNDLTYFKAWDSNLNVPVGLKRILSKKLFRVGVKFAKAHKIVCQPDAHEKIDSQ